MICPLMSGPVVIDGEAAAWVVTCAEGECPSWRGYCFYLRQQRPHGLPRPDVRGMVVTDCPKCGSARQLDWREGQPHTYDPHGLFAVCYRCRFEERVQALDAVAASEEATPA